MADLARDQLDLLLLAALRGGPAHGYTVIEHVRARSDGALELAEGTVYPALHRLEKDGVVESEWAEVGGRRRRVYKLTRKGRKRLGEHEAAWARFVAAVQGVVTSPFSEGGSRA